MAGIEVVCGPMFSGKTAELQRRLRSARDDGRTVQACKPLLDDRFAAREIVSHDGGRLRAAPVTAAAEIVPLAEGVDVVGIDEVQFLDPEIVPVAEDLARGGTRVILAGLDRDFRGLPFGPLPALLAVADAVDTLHGVCRRCGGPATMTQRIVDGRPAPFEAPTVLVGGRERYEPRCRACHEPGRPTAGQPTVELSRSRR